MVVHQNAFSFTMDLGDEQTNIHRQQWKEIGSHANWWIKTVNAAREHHYNTWWCMIFGALLFCRKIHIKCSIIRTYAWEAISVRLIYASFISIHHIYCQWNSNFFFLSAIQHMETWHRYLSSSPFWSSHSYSFWICRRHILFCGDVCFQNKSGFHSTTPHRFTAISNAHTYSVKMKYKRKYTQSTHTTAALDVLCTARNKKTI